MPSVRFLGKSQVLIGVCIPLVSQVIISPLTFIFSIFPVISSESPLIIGFVGKKEQTGHPSQKPEAVFDKLLLMAMADNQIVFDPMAGSGTTGASATKNGFRAILCDKNEEYISLMENRLNVKRISI